MLTELQHERTHKLSMNATTNKSRTCNLIIEHERGTRNMEHAQTTFWKTLLVWQTSWVNGGGQWHSRRTFSQVLEQVSGHCGTCADCVEIRFRSVHQGSGHENSKFDQGCHDTRDTHACVIAHVARPSESNASAVSQIRGTSGLKGRRQRSRSTHSVFGTKPHS